MKPNITPNDVQMRVVHKLRERKLRAEVSAHYKIFQSLQQMSLLCRLFNKQVDLKYFSEGILVNLVTPVYLVTPKTVILSDGRCIPVANVVEVKLR